MKKGLLSVTVIFLFIFLPSILTAQNFVEINAYFLESSNESQNKIAVDALFNFPGGYYQSNQPDYFNIRLNGFSEERTKVVYPDDEKFFGETNIRAEFSLPGTPVFPLKYEILLNYQLCDDSGTCLFPKSASFSFDFRNLDDALSGKSFILAEADYPEIFKKNGQNSFSETTDFSGPGKTSDSFSSADFSAGGISNAADLSFISVLIIISLAFLGGILLNIMPCVLPVLSLKALHLVGMSEKGHKARIREGSVYSLGIISSLFILGSLAATLKLLGEISGWGFQFQNPFFTVSLSFLVFMFALSMFDTYLINLPGLTVAEKTSHKSGTAGTFLSGVFAVLLATPCTAPFMGSALGLAFTLGPLVIIATFTAIGAGLALPFFLLSLFPGLLKWIPKPGNWMNIFKQFLGFMLFATLGWLLNSAYFQIGWYGIIKLFFIFLITALILWFFGNLQKTGIHTLLRKILLLVLIITVVTGVYITGNTQNEQEHELKSGWQEFSPQTLELERMKGNPVFIAFSAQWCLTCKTNETTVLNTRDMQSFFKREKVTLLYGDYTNNDPVIAEWINNFGRNGVPVYAYYAPGISEPVILPEILNKALVKNTILK